MTITSTQQMLIADRIKYFICILLLFISYSGFSQDKIKTIQLTDVKIVSAQTGKTLLRNSDFKNEGTIISKLGQPDSIKIEMTEAVGGKIKQLFYHGNRFYLPVGKHASEGYSLITDDFYVLIKDSVKVRVGDKINKLEQQIHPDRHFHYVPKKKSYPATCGFNIFYGYWKENKLIDSDVSIAIIYDCQSGIITKIYDSIRS